ncbi:MAG: hypothetical protein FJ253_08895 [Phycisphaerae bacterium]|nr:hypothetical protein [Phycisphaerae bacterium]
MNAFAPMLVAMTIASTAGAQVLWNEGVSGDASGNPSAPSNAGVVVAGSNLFMGSVTNSGGADQRDYITFVVPAGVEITQLILNTLSPNNLVWTHFDDGPTSVIPGAGTAASLLAGAHIEAATPDGTDLFPNYQAGSPDLLAGPGFSGPIAPGTYTFLMQQASPVLTTYSLNFVASSICVGDFNRDGEVDGDDLGTLLGSWGDCPGCEADFNSDDMVDGDDLGGLLGFWGPCS